MVLFTGIPEIFLAGKEKHLLIFVIFVKLEAASKV